jgi:glycosyltransferase involved in cell wall biosynthesis
MGNRKLSIVLPAHNEAGNIERVVTSFLTQAREQGLEPEIIIVNDGSTDETPGISHELARRHESVMCIDHPENLGYGAALRSGISASEGDYVAITDGDGQFDPDDLLGLLAYTDSYDVIVGYRMRRADPLGRRLLGYMWTSVGKWLFKVPIRDMNCALKLFKRQIIQNLELHCKGPGISLEIMAGIAASRIPIKEVGCSHLPRQSGSQSGASLRVVLRGLAELFHLMAGRHGLNRRRITRIDIF